MLQDFFWKSVLTAFFRIWLRMISQYRMKKKHCLSMASDVKILEAERQFNQSLESLREWSSQEINIGVIGQAKTGKSTVINTMLGYDYDEHSNLPRGAASVNESGVCTTEPCKYGHPESEQIKFWDLPGIDGTKFQLQVYPEKIRAKHPEMNPEGV